MKNLPFANLFGVTIAGTTATCIACESLLDASIKSMFLLAFSSLICMALMRNSAATRHLIWTANMTAMLMLPVFALLLPEWRVLPSWLSVEHRIGEPAIGTRFPVELIANAPPVQTPSPSPNSLTPMTVEHTPRLEERHFVFESNSETPVTSIKLSASVILLVWASGCLFWMSPIAIGFYRLRRIERQFGNAHPVSEKLSDRVQSLAKEIGTQAPRIVLGSADAMPMVWTFFRSRLLLPLDIEKWPDSRINAVLRHELIHLRRFDPTICTIGSLARAVNWFNPLAWYAVHRLRLECEYACDDQVLRQGADANDYATHILELSTSLRVTRNTGSLALAMATVSDVENRIAHILNEKQSRCGITPFRFAGSIVLTVIGIAMFASLATRLKSHDTIIQPVNAESLDSAVDMQVEQLAESASEGATDENNVEDPVKTAPTPSPISLSNQDFKFQNLSLEECITFALIHSGMARALPEAGVQNADPTAMVPTRSTKEPTTINDALLPIVKDQNGHSILSEGASPSKTARNASNALHHYDEGVSSQTTQANRDPATSNNHEKNTPRESQHPLERRGTLANRIPVVLERVNEDTAIGQFEERMRNLVRDVEFAYWDLFAAYFNVDMARTALDSAAVTHKTAIAKSKFNSANAEAQTRVTYHQFKAQLDSAIAGGGVSGNDPGLFGREQKLRLLIGWATNDGRLIRPSDKPAIGLTQFDWETVKEETLYRNIDLRQQKWLIKQRELELMSAKNIALPDVNLSLNDRWLDVQNMQLSLAREHRVLEAKEIGAVNKLSGLWQQVDSLYKQMTDQFQALNAAQTLVEVSQAKFDAGDSFGNSDATIDNLFRAQQTRAQAGQNYIRARVEYNKSLVEVQALKGSLLEYNNIVLQDGRPKKSEDSTTKD